MYINASLSEKKKTQKSKKSKCDKQILFSLLHIQYNNSLNTHAVL